ncbi:hypothetical protein HZB97_03765, partial [Candidatus Gottesmanbacteria bacterium]|nr:hypothetical protein [Candidatus Gottesmanbacteria bacterium]
IIALIKEAGYKLASGEQIVNKELLLKDRRLSKEKIFSREKKAIESADCLVAEVTSPSTGVGGEIAYALTRQKPALALFYKEAEDKLSPMIAGNPSDNLYLEHYDEDNLKIILQEFLEHVEKRKQKKGKLVIVEGSDGSGKATQTELLVDYLKKKKIPVKAMDFPRYYSSFHGKIVGRFLNGEFGKIDQVSPYLASLAYALDRAAAREEMEDWLGRGGLIVSNRYVTSNMAHQGAKLPQEKRDEFVKWVDELEYKVHKIPREDLVIYLYVPWKIGLELTKKKGERGYVKGLDIAEADIKHRQKAEKMYLWLAKTRKNWVKIDCLPAGRQVADSKIRPKQEIHQEILKVLKENGIL